MKDSFNIDLKYFDTGVLPTQSRNSNPKMSITYLSPFVIEKIYTELDIKYLSKRIKQIQVETPSFSMNKYIEKQKHPSQIEATETQIRSQQINYSQPMSTHEKRRKPQNINYNEYMYNPSSFALYNQGGMQQYPMSFENHANMGQHNENRGNLNTISTHLNRENSGSSHHNLNSMQNKTI